MIVDLSFPKGHSINDGVEPELCSLSYTSVDRAVQRILRRGADARLTKFDVKGAYRTVPVHPEDRHLLRVETHPAHAFSLKIDAEKKTTSSNGGNYLTC